VGFRLAAGIDGSTRTHGAGARNASTALSSSMSSGYSLVGQSSARSQLSCRTTAAVSAHATPEDMRSVFGWSGWHAGAEFWPWRRFASRPMTTSSAPGRPFNILQKVPCMSKAPLEPLVDEERALEQADDVEAVSSAESEKMRLSTAYGRETEGRRNNRAMSNVQCNTNEVSSQTLCKPRAGFTAWLLTCISQDSNYMGMEASERKPFGKPKHNCHHVLD